MNDTTLAAWTPRLLSVLRIITALLFLQHGLVKLLGWPMPGPAHLPPLMMAAAVIEVAGSVLVGLGLFTRLAAFIMSGEMAVAYFMGHAPSSFFPIANRGEGAILFCFIFLYVAAAGAGPWSVDAARK